MNNSGAQVESRINCLFWGLVVVQVLLYAGGRFTGLMSSPFPAFEGWTLQVWAKVTAAMLAVLAVLATDRSIALMVHTRQRSGRMTALALVACALAILFFSASLS